MIRNMHRLSKESGGHRNEDMNHLIEDMAEYHKTFRSSMEFLIGLIIETQTFKKTLYTKQHSCAQYIF